MEYTGKRPDDFRFVFEWNEASIPPPDHYEYTISAGPGLTAGIVYHPDYPGEGVPVREETLHMDAEILDRLYELMTAGRIFRGDWSDADNQPPGDEMVWLKGTVGDAEFNVPSSAAGSADVVPVYTAIRSLVPDRLWDELETWRLKYAEERY